MVGGLISEYGSWSASFKRLSKRQSDGAGQRKFCDCIVVARDAQVVLLGMKLNLRASRVDPRTGARLVLPTA